MFCPEDWMLGKNRRCPLWQTSCHIFIPLRA
jgi:hypothetical protein